MDDAMGIWTIIGVGIALAGLIVTQNASLRQDMRGQFASIQSQITNLQNQITGLQNQITDLVDRTARLETHVGILREDVAYLAGRRNEPESPPPDQPLEAP